MYIKTFCFSTALKTRTTRSRVESTKLSSSVRTTEISTLAYDTTPETYMTGQTPESSMHTLGTTAIYTFLTTFTIMYSTFEKTTGLVGTSNLRLWSGLQSTTDPNELSTVPFKTDLTTSTQTFKQGASETTSRETDGETHSVKITTLENSSSIGGWHRKQTSAIRALTATSRDNSNDTARPTNVDPTQTIKPIDQHQTSTFTDNHMNAVDDASTPKMSSYMYYLQLYIALAVFI